MIGGDGVGVAIVVQISVVIVVHMWVHPRDHELLRVS